MTRHADEPRLPGRLLLRVARLLFDEPALTTVISAAIADLQREVRDATNGVARLRARVQGYVAFWKLVVAAPLVLPVASTRRPLTTLLLGKSGGHALIVFVVALFAGSWPLLGPFIAAAVVCGALLALALRWWHVRHPSKVAPGRPLASLPDAQINLSSIPVGADIGGLLFVIGAVVTMLLGLPASRWFILGSLLCGFALAVVVFAWRSTHPAEPASSISLR